MSIFQPIVYTRPFRHNVMDYCYFVLPEALKGYGELSSIDRHIKNVLAVESGRGDIRGNRWHIFRFDDYVLLGLATESFGRHDETGVPIRGYYGVLMSVADACVPPLRLFSEMDTRFVEPHFNDYKNFELSYSPNLSTCGQFKYVPEACVGGEVVFNYAKDKLMFLSEAVSADCYLRDALNAAQVNRSFEFVYGFNTEAHSCELEVMNVVCYGVKPKLVSLCERRVQSSDTASGSVRHTSFSSRGANKQNIGRALQDEFVRKDAEASEKDETASPKFRTFGIEYAEEDEGVLTGVIQRVIRSLVWLDAHIDRREHGKEKCRIYSDGERGLRGCGERDSALHRRKHGEKTPDYTFGMSVERP